MINNSALENILETMDDFSVIVELYAPEAEPPFDPGEAVLRYSSADNNFADLQFLGASYTRLIKSFGRIKRTITEELNSASVDLSNLDNQASNYELTTGYEGLIKVIRLISRAQSDSVNKSLILFAGRMEQPTGGNRESLSLKANQIFGAIDAEIPRRKFSPDDPEGRSPQDPNFEGFRFIPQYGVSTYSAREPRGGLFGLFGLKKNVTKNLTWSSYSDLDADQYLIEGFGRVQVMCTHLAYADLGTYIRFTSAIMEGKILDFINWRTDDPRFNIFTLVHKRFGFAAGDGPVDNPGGPGPGGIYTQQPIPEPIPGPVPHWVGNGYYARTACIMSQCNGSNAQTRDAAPGIIVVAMAKLVTLPDGSGNWNRTDKWTDDPAAHTRFLLTSPDYGKLSAGWINDRSFFESYNFNNEFIFDTSFSDLIFTPATANFEGEGGEKSRYFVSTGFCGPEYFKLLAGDATETETFLRTPFAENYDSVIPIEPPEPGPTEPIPTSSGLSYFIRRRYTCNIVCSEQTKLTDFIHKSLFTTCRGFFSQDEQGRLKMNNKKPADWCLAIEAISGASFDVDDISRFAADPSRFLLIDPHTGQAEVRIIQAAQYGVGAPALDSKTPYIAAGAFSGGNGDDVPETASFTVSGGFVGGEIMEIEVGGIDISFMVGTADTPETVAGFIYATINAHPVISRQFRASWTPGTSVVTIEYLSGTITLTEAVEMSHAAPLANPDTAPSLAATASGSLAAGTYRVAYTVANHRGETLLSGVGTVTLAANQKITVTGVSLPSGASEIRWYSSPAKDSAKLRHVLTNDGSGFEINALPRLDDALPPMINRTAAEIVRVQAVFSDRAETRSSISRSNVLKATYKWRLPNAKPVNEIRLKYRDATQDWRLIELVLRDKRHIAKIKKTNKLEINGQGIDNHNQAYRIAAGELAERLDANFLYEWESDRKALLLEEGDVVAITDGGSGVINLPVRIETNEYDVDRGFVKVSFTARKYATTLFDDSAAERNIPVIIETGQVVDYISA